MLSARLLRATRDWGTFRREGCFRPEATPCGCSWRARGCDREIAVFVQLRCFSGDAAEGGRGADLDRDWRRGGSSARLQGDQQARGRRRSAAG
jgi:hypothetical protein